VHSPNPLAVWKKIRGQGERREGREEREGGKRGKWRRKEKKSTCKYKRAKKS
jgi:hypothetical protein